jgi:hypothetical protein
VRIGGGSLKSLVVLAIADWLRALDQLCAALAGCRHANFGAAGILGAARLGRLSRRGRRLVAALLASSSRPRISRQRRHILGGAVIGGVIVGWYLRQFHGRRMEDGPKWPTSALARRDSRPS